MYIPFSSSSLVNSGLGLFGGDFGLKIKALWIKKQEKTGHGQKRDTKYIYNYKRNHHQKML